MTDALSSGAQRNLKRLQSRFRRLGVDGLLVTNVHNVRYLSGFKGDDSALLVSSRSGDGASWLITDSRYTEQAGHETTGVTVVTRKRASLMRAAGRLASRAGLGRLGFEADALTVKAHAELTRWTGKADLVPTEGEVGRLRTTKSRTEVAAIQRAIDLAERAFAEVRSLVRPGVTERQLAAALEHAMQRHGAEGPAFPTIVAAGERASLPHARPTERKISPGDGVLFDWGARVDFYNSDLTRMAFVGTLPRLLKGLYSLALRAQARALRRIRPGIAAGEVDRAARDCIREKRRGKYFGHALGHGVGLEVHEAPTVRSGAEAELRPGMVFTVEPGIYVPGKAGVRIEDMVLVTRSGCRVLTSTPKSINDMLIRT